MGIVVVVGLAAVIKIMEILYKTRLRSNHKNSPKLSHRILQFLHFLFQFRLWPCTTQATNNSNNWSTQFMAEFTYMLIYVNAKRGVAAL